MVLNSSIRQWFVLARRLAVAWVLLLALMALMAGGQRNDVRNFRIAFGACASVISYCTFHLRRPFGVGDWRKWGQAPRVLGASPHFCQPHSSGEASLPAAPTTRSRLLRTGRVLEVVACNLAVFLVLGEVGLRVLNACAPSALLLPRTLDSFRLEPGRDYGAGLKGNRLGYPGDDHAVCKPTGTFRIAALGDSFAVGAAVAYSDNYLERLESTLPGVELLNFGVSGTGPREYLEILQTHAQAFGPDLVLVSFFVGNDVTESLAVPRGIDPRQYLLYLALQRGGRLLRQPSIGSPAGDRLAGSGYSPAQFLEIEARRLEICHTPIPPDLEKKWLRALERINAIADLCRSTGKRVAVVLIPDEFQVNDQLRDAARLAAGWKADEIDLELPQARLLEFLSQRQIPCLDLLPVLKQCSGAYALRDTHWNALGNRVAASAIADWLRAEDLVPVSRLASAPPRQAP